MYPDCLQDLENVKLEFIPFFLNYLRDHTIHLLQSTKSATPSPAKTPSLKKIQKTVKRNKETGRKRQQLFGASPAGDSDDLHSLPVSVFSPNTSLDSPGNVQINQKCERHNGKGHLKSGNASQKCSPRCGSQRSPYSQITPEQRSKQKFSLGEFMNTPDRAINANGWKRKSPHSGNKKENVTDISPSFPGSHSRRSGGKKRLVPNHTPIHTHDKLEAPVFSLTNANDFPPMGQKASETGNKKTQNNRLIDSNMGIQSYKSSDTKASRVIIFSNSESNSLTTFPRDMSQEHSLVTVPSAIPGPRRITPTVLKTDNSMPQNTAFLVPIEEHKATTKSSVKCDSSESVPGTASSHLSREERVLLK